MIEKIRVLKTILSLLFFMVAVLFEGASHERLALLLGLFAAYLAWTYIRVGWENSHPWLYLLDVVFLYCLEYQSKFLVNYFFHSLYVLAIVEVGLALEQRPANLLNACLAGVSMLKFGWRLFNAFHAGTVAEFLFNLFALAFLITLLNYSWLQREERRKNQVLYEELLQAHRQLKDYAARAQESAVLEERARIAREIHDAVGHRLTAVIMQLEMSSHMLDKNPEQAQELLAKAKEGAREGLRETRRAVNALKDQEASGYAGIRELVRQFAEDTNVKIELNFPELDLTPLESVALYRALQEAITNAVRHGSATAIKIDASTEEDQLLFTVGDNGKGGQYQPGFGLKNMQERLEKLGGSLAVIEGQRFLVQGRLPLTALKRWEIN